MFSLSLSPKSCRQRNSGADVAFILDASMSMAAEISMAKGGLKRLIATTILPSDNIRMSIVAAGGVNRALEDHPDRLKGHQADAIRHPDILALGGGLDAGCNFWRSQSRPFPYGVGNKNYGHLLPMTDLNGGESADRIHDLIDGLGLYVSTPLSKAMMFSHREDLDNHNRRRFMVVLSDGQDTCRDTRDQAIQALRADGVQLFGIRYLDDRQDISGATFFDDFNLVDEVNAKQGSADTIEADFVRKLRVMFGRIKEQRQCAVKAQIFRSTSLDHPVARIDSGDIASLPRGNYQIVLDLCDQTQVLQDFELADDHTITTTLDCPDGFATLRD